MRRHGLQLNEHLGAVAGRSRASYIRLGYCEATRDAFHHTHYTFSRMYNLLRYDCTVGNLHSGFATLRRLVAHQQTLS